MYDCFEGQTGNVHFLAGLVEVCQTWKDDSMFREVTFSLVPGQNENKVFSVCYLVGCHHREPSFMVSWATEAVFWLGSMDLLTNVDFVKGGDMFTDGNESVLLNEDTVSAEFNHFALLNAVNALM